MQMENVLKVKKTIVREVNKTLKENGQKFI